MASATKTEITAATWLLAIIELLIIIAVIVGAIVLIVKLVKRGKTTKERTRAAYSESRSASAPVTGAASFDTKGSDTSSGFASTFTHDYSTPSALRPPNDSDL